MKIITRIAVLALITSLVSCSTSKTLKFTKAPDDIIKTESLKDFLNTNKNPKVVLRVNSTSFAVTENENNDYLFNAIENQLLANGFIVRDRQLFNQIIANSENSVDYSKLKEKSDTDLIIELTKLDSKVLYETNQYYDQKNNLKVDKEYVHTYYGASVEFKVVIIKSNEFAGAYKFNYTPCVNGCVVSKSLKELQKERKEREKQKEKGYEGVERNELEEFIKNATDKLVEAMRM